ncbi:MAG TPA: heme-binding protein [bacterium]|nr:heme-binding protein [bacterium]
MHGLTLEQSNRIITATLAKGREMGLPPLGVAVLDPGGHLIAMQREDGLTFLRVRICQAKAYGSLAMGMHSRHLAERYAGGTTQQGFFQALNGMTGGQVVSVPGGVLVQDADGTVLGAVGVSGAASEDDEACAVAGIEAIGYTVTL